MFAPHLESRVFVRQGMYPDGWTLVRYAVGATPVLGQPCLTGKPVLLLADCVFGAWSHREPWVFQVVSLMPLGQTQGFLCLPPLALVPLGVYS